MRRRDLRNGAVAASVSRRAAAALLLVVCAGLVSSVVTPTSTTIASSAIAAEPVPADERGQYVYTEGKSRSNRVITSVLRRGEAPVPAAILPCGSCHGTDGRGAADYSGVAPLNINWYALAQAGKHEHGARRHAAFDEKSLARAIVDGTDPDGNALDSTMPRYDMSDEDMADLIAYLKVIDSETDPGISATSIRIGTVLPMQGQLAGMGEAMRDTIEAYFSTVNTAGGVHGRKLELVIGTWGENDDPPIWSARNLVDNELPFALVSGYVPNYDAEFEALSAEKKIPLIGPYTALLPRDSGENDGENNNEARNKRFSFYSVAGLAEQAEVLVEAVAADMDSGQTRVAVVYPQVRSFDVLAESARARAAELGFRSATDSAYRFGQFDSEATVTKLRDNQVDAVVFLGSAEELLQLGRAAERAGWLPYLLSPGLLAESRVFDLPKSFSGRVLLSYASLPTDYTPEGSAEFEKLHDDFGFDYRYSIAQIAAYTAAKITVEGLERAGRNLSREELVLALEGVKDYHPGLVPPVSFGPDRRIGALGAHIVRVDLAAGRFDESTQWIGLGG